MRHSLRNSQHTSSCQKGKRRAELWDTFCSAYERASRAVLGWRGFGTEDEVEEGRLGVERVMELPGRFLKKVVEMTELHGGWDPESDIVFGE